MTSILENVQYTEAFIEGGSVEECEIATTSVTGSKLTMLNRMKLSALMVVVLISSGVMGVLSPLIVTYYVSDYFVVFATTLEFLLIFGLLYLIVVKNKTKPKEGKLIVLLGVLNAIMAMSYLYSSDPMRTPPVMQSTLTGIAVIPSAIIKRYVFGNTVEYNSWFISFSIFFLVASVCVSAYPLIENMNGNYMMVFWCCLYLAGGVCVRSWYNVIQELYVKKTEHSGQTLTFKESLGNKIELSFFSMLIMIGCIVPLSGFEWIIYSGSNRTDWYMGPLYDFNNSFHEAFTTVREGLFLQSFIFSYLILFFSAIYLNAISTNYHMILTAICNPLVALFYTIFPSLNPGIQYPLWATLLSLLCGISSVVLWMFGEGKSNKKCCNNNIKMLQ